MQKKILALAIAGLSTAAFAQSNVTIYGQLNPSYDFVKVSNVDRVSDMTYNNSRIGFKGEEALGNGLKAVFQIESKVDLTSKGAGGTSFADRDSFAGLSSATLGTITFGNHQGAYKQSTNDFDIMQDSIGDYNAVMSTFARTTVASGVTTVDNYDWFQRRQDKSAYYTSPTWAGVKVQANYALKTTGVGGAKEDNEFGASVNYDNGPLGLVASYIDEHVANSADVYAYKLGASYKFGPAKLLALYEKAKTQNAPANTDINVTRWYVAGIYTIGAVDLLGNYAHAGDYKGAGGVSDSGAKFWSLGAKYNLSKRTNVLAAYAKIDNKANGVYALDSNSNGGSASVNTVAAPTVFTGQGADVNAYSVRLQHFF